MLVKGGFQNLEKSMKFDFLKLQVKSCRENQN